MTISLVLRIRVSLIQEAEGKYLLGREFLMFRIWKMIVGSAQATDFDSTKIVEF
jgi:hypothetical protein